jgi:hypothetical protein
MTAVGNSNMADKVEKGEAGGDKDGAAWVSLVIYQQVAFARMV